MHMTDKKIGKMGRVRTTVTFDPDVAKILERLRIVPSRKRLQGA